MLVEKRTKDKNLKGRSRCWKSVIFAGEDFLIGSLQTIKITGFTNQTLLGELVPHLSLLKAFNH